MNIAHRARIIIVRFAKAFPFILCFILLLSYTESMYATIIGDYATYGNYIVLNTPLSWYIGDLYEYNVYSIIVALMLAFAMETCIYNRLSIMYLLLHIVFKHYIEQYELYIEEIYITVIANILLSGFFCYKGLRILTSINK